MAQRLPALLYHLGSKYLLAPWILSHIPLKLQTSLPLYEVYGGSGSVLLSKPPSEETEVWNELNPHTYNFFTMLQNFPYDLSDLIYTRGFETLPFPNEEDYTYLLLKAAKFFFHSKTSYRGSGTAWDSQTSAYKLGCFYRRQAKKDFHLLEYAERLQSVQLLSKDAILLIESSDQDAIIYADPPYPHSVRKGKDSRHKNQRVCKSRNQYLFDYEEQDHINLLSVCLRGGGLILLSSYRNQLYDDHLLPNGWGISTSKVKDQAANTREEVLYLSPELMKHYQKSK